MIRNRYGLLFWLHATVIVIAYLSWLLLDWYWVIAAFALYQLQLFVLGDCILSRAQFGRIRPDGSQSSFCYQYLSWMGFTDRQFTVFSDYIMPPVTISLAVIGQLFLGLRPLWF